VQHADDQPERREDTVGELLVNSAARDIAARRICRCRPRPAGAGGFTLVELAVVIAMVAVIATLAAPSFRSFIGTMNAKSAAFDLINDLSIARSEAIKLNQTTTLAPVSSSWANGWRVSDANGNVLRERAALASSLSISGAAVAGVAFRPNGRLADDTADQNLSWGISSSIAGVTARCVVISPTGAARSKSGGC
jgi:type IV fimbrial biogenesis protein FimT